MKTIEENIDLINKGQKIVSTDLTKGQEINVNWLTSLGEIWKATQWYLGYLKKNNKISSFNGDNSYSIN